MIRPARQPAVSAAEPPGPGDRKWRNLSLILGHLSLSEIHAYTMTLLTDMCRLSSLRLAHRHSLEIPTREVGLVRNDARFDLGLVF